MKMSEAHRRVSALDATIAAVHSGIQSDSWSKHDTECTDLFFEPADAGAIEAVHRLARHALCDEGKISVHFADDDGLERVRIEVSGNEDWDDEDETEEGQA